MGRTGPGYSWGMDYLSALVPPAVMAVAFTYVIRAIIRSQGGPNKAKEDAVADAIARAQAEARSAKAAAQAQSTASGAAVGQ